MGRRRIDGRALKPLRTLCELGVVGNWSDGQLLDKFLDGTPAQAELAFEEIVERHGLMVRDVCRAILGDPHEAQDAFQATFLVLARRAWTIRHADSVGPWLFGVARKLSMRAKARIARRRVVEQRGAERNQEARSGPAEAVERAESQAILHEEIARLPERYRAVIVLCDLERLSHEQAALRLSCPVETLRTRLTRGRARLRERLIRRGLAPTVGLLATSVSTPTASAWISPTLASSTARAALAYRTLSTASASTVSATAAALADGLLRSTLMTKLGLTATGLLAVFTVGTGVGVGVLSHPAPAVAPQDPDEPPPPSSIDEPPQQKPATEEKSEPVANEVSTEPVSIRNPLMETTTIISLVKPGTRVEKGQLIAELDSHRFRDQFTEQMIATEQAKADYEIVTKKYEVALITIKEYDEGIYLRELKSIDGDIAIAKAELELARDRVEEAKALFQTAGGSRLAIKEAEVEVLRAEVNLQRAEEGKNVLINYTREKQLKTLQGAVESARAEMLAKEATFNLEVEKEERLRRSIENCKIYAPIDGVVQWAETDNGIFIPAIREGSVVRERQLMMLIVPEEEEQ